MIRIDKMAAVVFSGLAFACVHSAELGVQGTYGKILFLGNSITLHAPAPEIGWNNNWGMAASAESKDYVHLVAAAVAAKTGSEPSVMARNIADFERAYTSYDVDTQLADAFAFKPDLFFLSIGENVPELNSEEQKAQFKSAVRRIIDGVLAQNSQATVIVRSCFWADTEKDLALSQVSQQTGAVFVNIGALGADLSNHANAETAYPPSALVNIGTHPGDKGMAAIASALVQAILPQTTTTGTAQDFGYGTDDLPTDLRGSAGLAFWVDANRNVATDGGGTVTAWNDAREVSGGTVYPRARPYGSEPAPTLVTGGEDVGGNLLVDFGAFQSGKWLEWQNADGSQHRIGGIRTVFMVVSCTNGTGFLLGDATGNPGGNYCFHVDNFGTDGLATRWFQISGGGPDADHPVRYGLTRVDGLLTDGMRTAVPHAGTLLSIQTANAVPVASNFGNDRNLNNGEWGTTENRQGGGRIGEALIYTAELSDDQRQQVEAYLMKKWLRKTRNPVHVGSGSTLTMAAGNALDLATVTGAGTIEVTGAGNITLPDGINIAVPAIRLDAGASASGQHPGQTFALDGGSVYDVANGISARTALGESAVITKTGDGVLTASSVDAGVTCVNVNAGTLRLSPPLPGMPEVLSNAPSNGGFEDSPLPRPEETVEHGLVYIENQSYAGWTYTWGGSGSGNCGLARYGGSFCDKTPPDGDWVLFLCNDCTVAGTFTAPLTGRYEVSFFTASAKLDTWMWHLYQVLVDGTNVIGSIRTSGKNYQFVTCRTPVLEAGAHTLSFQGIAEANRVALVDKITVRPCVEADEVEVPNGGFEAPSSLTTGSSYDRPYAYFESMPTNAGWVFDGDYAGITEGYGTWRCMGMEEGGHAAFLCCNGGGGSMAAPITFPTAGLYRVTFKAACRTSRVQSAAGFERLNEWNYGQTAGGNPFSVTLNGVKVVGHLNLSPSMGEFVAYEYILPPVTNGALTQMLAFEVIPIHEWNTVLIDDVRVFKIPDIQNPGFEDDTAEGRGWILDNGDGVATGLTTPGNDYWYDENEIPEGARCLLMERNGSASQNVAFATSGTYELSLLASQSKSSVPGHQFEVIFNGMKVGSVQTMSRGFKRYHFRLPYVKAGNSYSLVIQGLPIPGTMPFCASLIDSVILRKVPVEPAAFGERDFAKAAFVLAADTKLELDYSGTVLVDRIAYAGTSYSGILSATTAPFIKGVGSVLVRPKGTIMTVR